MNSYASKPLKYFRDNVKGILGLNNTTQHDLFFNKRLLRAASEIYSDLQTFNTDVDIEVIDFVAQLPNNFKEFTFMVADPNSDSCDCTTDCNCCNQLFIYTDQPLNIENCNVWGFLNSKRFTLELANGIIRFPSNFTGTSVRLYYTAYNLDEQGFQYLKLAHEKYYEEYLLAWWDYTRDYKAFLAKKQTYVNTRKALIHNENVENFRLDKENIRNTIYSNYNYTNGLWQRY